MTKLIMTLILDSYKIYIRMKKLAKKLFINLEFNWLK